MTAGAFLDLAKFLQEQPNPDEEIYKYLSITDRIRLGQWLDRLQVVRDFPIPTGKKKKIKQAQRSRLQGKILEQAVRVLLDGCKCISHGGNVRSTTSEIDFLIKIGPTGIVVPALRKAGTHLLGEAKCYATAPKTEWVNELAGLLPSHGTNVAILFAASPPKKLHSEIRTSIAIHSGRGISIIPFGLTQFGRVLSGENFLQVLDDQAVKASAHLSSLSV